jgi:hypothetical protein
VLTNERDRHLLISKLLDLGQNSYVSVEISQGGSGSQS